MNKTIFNTNWDLDNNGIRKIELDYLKNTNSGLGISPVDGTNKTISTFWFARKRLINLIDIWNRILNSGLFVEDANVNIIGGNACVGETPARPTVLSGNKIVTDYLFTKIVNGSNAGYTGYDFRTTSIYSNIKEFLGACSKLHTYILSGNVPSQVTIDGFFNYPAQANLKNSINYRFDTRTNSFVNLMDELINAVKEIISEEKLASECLFDFVNFNFNTTIGLSNILNLKAYSVLSKTNATKFPVITTWENEDPSSFDLAYPQFATIIALDADNQYNTLKNVLVSTDNFSLSDVANAEVSNLSLPNYLACTIFQTSKPVKFRTQLIDWENAMDKPYIMSYNSSAYIYIPDSIKDQNTLGTYSEQPSNQINISSFFWEIGTSNVLDQNYTSNSDIKLNITKTLTDVDKLDFLDNLSTILKLN